MVFECDATATDITPFFSFLGGFQGFKGFYVASSKVRKPDTKIFDTSKANEEHHISLQHSACCSVWQPGANCSMYNAGLQDYANVRVM